MRFYHRPALWARTFAVLAAGFALAASVSSATAQELSDAEFDKLQLELLAPREPWQAVPWKLSVLEAQQHAARAKMPVYMLVRAGHPLGCV